MSLHRLIYLSSATWQFRPGDLETILETARVNNAANEITGLLIFHDGSFLQVLEGESEKVLACFDRIRADPRNSGFILLQSEDVGERLCAEWHMASSRFDGLSLDCQERFVELQSLHSSAQMSELARDEKSRLFTATFLASFRDLQMQ